MVNPNAMAATHFMDDPEEDAAHQPAFIVRQPLLDQHDTIVGYELILETDEPAGPEYDLVLLGMFASPQIGKLTEHRLTLITLSPETLCHPSLAYLPSANVIVAVRGPQSATPQFLSDLRTLKERGLRVALDVDGYSPALQPLLDVARYARLNVASTTGLQLNRSASDLIEKSGVHLIAAHLQCLEEFDLCRNLPFEFYQGQYFALGQYKRELTVDHSRATVIELLNLARSNAELRHIEGVFRRDPLLTYQLLRYINSPGCGMVREVRSIPHALMVLGYNQLYRWLTLLLFTRTAAEHQGNAYLTNALVRGRLVELLGQDHIARPQRDSLFIVGVFSLLDSMLGVPIERALDGVHLTPEAEAALIHRTGLFAPYLSLALACENRLPERIASAAAACAMEADAVNAMHMDALIWATSVLD